MVLPVCGAGAARQPSHFRKATRGHYQYHAPRLGYAGHELAERLAPKRPEMKMLYMSGYTDDSVVRNGLLESSAAFIQKPFTPDALVRKVREVLDASPSSK